MLKDLTVAEVEHALTHYVDPKYPGHQMDWDSWEEAMNTYDFETKETTPLVHEVRPLGWVQVLENFGGEGMGDSMWIVFKVWDYTGVIRHFKMNGCYQSFSGGEWDGPFEEVQPIVRQVTFYE